MRKTLLLKPLASVRGQLLFLIALFGVISQANAQCPVASTCTPGNAPSVVFPFGMGIYNVVVGGTPGFTNPTGGVSQGYMDYSCTKKATVAEGTNVPITVTTNNFTDENVRVWIDLNNNGAFDPVSELVFSSNNARIHNGTFTIPVSGLVVKNTVLRMRVASDDNGSPIPTPCSTPAFGQFEDYGITVTANLAKPLVNFTVNNPVTCSPTVQFTQLTQNGATSFTWYFGDNTTSTAPNPSKTYAATGPYTVKLVACNAAGCDSLEKVNYINYHTNVPIAATCSPATLNYCCGYGITNFTLHTLVNASADGSAGYEDFTCTKSVTLEEGVSYPITLTTSAGNDQDTWIYIDYNNNGNFETNELTFTKLNAKNPTGNLVTQGGGVRNTPLRMRVISDFSGAASSPCFNRTHGQVEDYTVILTPNTRKPAIDFTSNFSNPCDSIIQFTDLSLNAPTSFEWNFGDGSPVSTQRNPTHEYNTPGMYPVTLKACNANGCDSLTKVNYISYTKPCLNYCIPNRNSNNTFWITNVTLNTLANASGQDGGGYGNYTHLNTSLVLGSTYPITVTASSNFNRTTTVWIDYNRDGDFFDAGEMVVSGTSANPFTRNITISGSAQPGPTRMRVMSRTGTTTLSPCLSNQFNLETEDYTIILQPNTLPPTAMFYTPATTVCNLTVAFFDTSGFTPTSWSWDFGDPASGANNTSNLQNPTHTFSGPGVYTIKLTVCNAYGCNVITKTSYLTINGNSGPRTASCQPVSTAPCCGLGIYNVSLNTINHTTGGGTDGYKDYTCSQQTTLIQGNAYNLVVTNGTGTPENVRAWIDYNNDGVFNATTEVVMTSTSKLVHTASIMPPTNAVLNQPLRLRISSDWSSNPMPGPCSNVQYSQVEDYTVIIASSTSVPVAAFTPSSTTSCGQAITFTDNSTFSPTSWAWDFGDTGSGANNTSTLQNPSHTFSGPGTYTVTLTACNANGCSSPLIRTNLITVTGNISLAATCQPVTLANCCGVGIRNVTFLGINHSSADGSEGYKDFSCAQNQIINQGTFTLDVLTGTGSNENALAWIDYNNDGQFTANEQIMNSLNAMTHSATVTLPTNAVLNTWLRMRIISDYAANPVPGACSDVQFGQAEDYAVKIIGLGIKENAFERALRLYPNPTTGKFTLELPATYNGTYQLEAQNLIGQTVASGTVKVVGGQTRELDLSHLAKGVYLVKVHNAEVSAFKKLIIE
ncbi:MAG TPA: GEVED domain-containing protein [Adhaeribacter sp.]|nr:GEVED domain-containing protein [Adhaeribacter sp.]